MSKGSKRRPSKGYSENYEKAFGHSGPIRTEKRQRERKKEFSIHKDIEPFISPITRKPITSRSHLREHNRRYGVTDARDYSESYYEKHAIRMEKERTGNTPKDRKHRIELLKHHMGMD